MLAIASFIIRYVAWQALNRFPVSSPRRRPIARVDCRHEMLSMTFLDPGAFLVTYLVRPGATSSSNGHQTILCPSYWRCAACALASEAFMPLACGLTLAEGIIWLTGRRPRNSCRLAGFTL